MAYAVADAYVKANAAYLVVLGGQRASARGPVAPRRGVVALAG